MCGIAGIVDWSSPPVAHDLEPLLNCIVHRGPDSGGIATAGPAVLGMRRLAIIDIAGGTQPMRSADGRYTLVFNGQIYNYVELRQELERRGFAFNTRSDTEVLLSLLIVDGTAALPRLNGMFAFALWDAFEGKLLLARDRFGIKPLYVTGKGSRIGFGSELKSLMHLPWASREIRNEAVGEYLQLGYVRSPHTLFRAIDKLPPAGVMEVTRNERRTWTYWIPDHSPLTISRDDARSRLRCLLNESIRLRQRSDVPVGAFLSGGLDSSAVVALLAQQVSGPVRTFTVRFAEDGIDEAPFARLVAERYATQHQEVQVTTSEAFYLLPKLAWHLDEPQADTAALPTFLISQTAATELKVILTGVGGDELFGGYTRYFQGTRAEHLYRRIPRCLRSGLITPLAGHMSDIWGWRAQMNNQNAANRLLLQSSNFSNETLPDLLGYAPTHAGFEEAYRTAAAADPINRLMAIDLESYLPEDVLHMTDRMSMAVSLEAREPLLDPNLVDFMLRIPSTMKLNQRDRGWKLLFKEAVEDIVPMPILQRGKQGFGGPAASWMRKGLFDTLMSLSRDAATVRHGLLDRAGLLNYLNNGASYDGIQRGQRLWTLLMLELWSRVFLDGKGAEPQVSLAELARL